MRCHVHASEVKGLEAQRREPEAEERRVRRRGASAPGTKHSGGVMLGPLEPALYFDLPRSYRPRDPSRDPEGGSARSVSNRDTGQGHPGRAQGGSPGSAAGYGCGVPTSCSSKGASRCSATGRVRRSPEKLRRRVTTQVRVGSRLTMPSGPGYPDGRCSKISTWVQNPSSPASRACVSPG